ncbi:hypothetical protein ACWGPT_09445 [Pseudorhizobium sp. NPDC055634]
MRDIFDAIYSSRHSGPSDLNSGLSRYDDQVASYERYMRSIEPAAHPKKRVRHGARGAWVRSGRRDL